jgi:aspartyl-tRNA synthetase
MEPAETLNTRATTLRTHTCGELRISDVGKEVTLCGWVQTVRSKKAVFIALRDRYGITQIFIDPTQEELAKKVYLGMAVLIIRQKTWVENTLSV